MEAEENSTEYQQECTRNTNAKKNVTVTVFLMHSRYSQRVKWSEVCKTDNSEWNMMTGVRAMSTCHPFNEDVDVSHVLCGSETADNVGVAESTDHGNLLLQSLQFLLLLALGVPHIAHLGERERRNTV